MPDAGFRGTDTFTYQVTDGSGTFATGTVTIITVDPAAVAPVSNPAGPEGPGTRPAPAPAVSPVVAASTPAADRRGTLPETGTSPLVPISAGLLLLGLGVGVTAAARRRLES